jgi:hypothetical protein
MRNDHSFTEATTQRYVPRTPLRQLNRANTDA